MKDLKINIPEAIKVMLNNPPLLPNESEEQFQRVYADFFDPLAPETIAQYWLVWNASVLTWEVMRYSRMKIAYVFNQHRAAVGGLIRKAFPIPAMRALRAPGSDIDENIERFFADPDYATALSAVLQKSGYSVEAEVFARALLGLSQIERLIVGAEKRLMLFFREMERIHGIRAVEAHNIATKALQAEG